MHSICLTDTPTKAKTERYIPERSWVRLGQQENRAVDSDLLFMHTCSDLARRVHQPASEYDVLMAAALLRKLLLDDQPLVFAVNRERRTKIRYRAYVHDLPWREQPGLPVADAWAVPVGIDPGSITIPTMTPQELTHDQFLKMLVVYVKGHEYTVHDVIKHVAHVSGAVHKGAPSDERDEALAAGIEGLGGPNGWQPAVAALPGIGRVVLTALSPLGQRVADERGLS